MAATLEAPSAREALSNRAAILRIYETKKMWYNNGSIKIQAKRCRIMANRINYQLEMEKVLRRLGDTKPTLLLHACCAPCSSATLERLAEHFRLSILYYNPNIYPPAEYHRREAELDEYEQLLFSEDFSHEEPAAEETAAADEADDAEDDIAF